MKEDVKNAIKEFIEACTDEEIAEVLANIPTKRLLVEIDDRVTLMQRMTGKILDGINHMQDAI